MHHSKGANAPMTKAETFQCETDAMLMLGDLYGWRVQKTTEYARMDGIISNAEGDMLFVYEFKCRDLSLDELNKMGSFLLTYEKITDGCHAARVLGVPFILVAYLRKSENIVVFRIANDKGDLLFAFDVNRTTTQANIYGGIVERYNAFLPVSDMKVVK